MKIEVTAEDIANGQPGMCGDCPVALACKRAGLEFPEIMSDGGRVSWEDSHGYKCERIAPPEVQNFVIAFDDESEDGLLKKTCAPFSFELNTDDARVDDDDEESDDDKESS